MLTPCPYDPMALCLLMLGAGKSSLVQCLFRLNILSDGTIHIGDKDTSSMPLQSLRSVLTLIPQDPHFFSGTIRDNLDPFSNHTDERLWSAINAVELGAAIGTLTMRVEERGENFSAGKSAFLLHDTALHCSHTRCTCTAWFQNGAATRSRL